MEKIKEKINNCFNVHHAFGFVIGERHLHFQQENFILTQIEKVTFFWING
jgi:hypothetical protein